MAPDGAHFCAWNGMKEDLADWLPRYDDCPAHSRLELPQMSASTLGRYLQDVRETLEIKKGVSSTSPARHIRLRATFAFAPHSPSRHMKNKIPINTLDHKIIKPGFTQTDTVAHCGDSTAGQYLNSITHTDVFSAWTENRALAGKTGKAVTEMMKDIEGSRPYKLPAINSDSGSEFLNKPMLKFTNYGQ